MNPFQIALCCCFLLFRANLAAAMAGHRFARRQVLAHPEGQAGDSGNVDAVILSMLGLLTAFTFSAAYSRYETRRQLIVDEANALGTAWLRLDLLPDSDQPHVRSLFHEYVEARARIWPAMFDADTASREYESGMSLQALIWSAVIAATKDETHGDARKLIVPALNDVFDISTTRLIAIQAHPPMVIFFSAGGIFTCSSLPHRVRNGKSGATAVWTFDGFLRSGMSGLRHDRRHRVPPLRLCATGCASSTDPRPCCRNLSLTAGLIEAAVASQMIPYSGGISAQRSMSQTQEAGRIFHAKHGIFRRLRQRACGQGTT